MRRRSRHGIPVLGVRETGSSLLTSHLGLPHSLKEPFNTLPSNAKKWRALSPPGGPGDSLRWAPEEGHEAVEGTGRMQIMRRPLCATGNLPGEQNALSLHLSRPQGAAAAAVGRGWVKLFSDFIQQRCGNRKVDPASSSPFCHALQHSQCGAVRTCRALSSSSKISVAPEPTPLRVSPHGKSPGASG